MTKHVNHRVRYFLMLACALVTASPLTVWASDGTLSFVGAIATPTCVVSATFGEDRMPTGLIPDISHTACPEPDGSRSNATRYSLDKETILATSRDPLLAYFYGYSKQPSNTASQPPTVLTVAYL